ncbi:MAG: TPM domain-containing protein [Catonella sp.]|uniref:TPM domain-containing protein n=1 Tax=Catonella sp. TaxID=2382125 RepID=UPI003F9EEF80
MKKNKIGKKLYFLVMSLILMLSFTSSFNTVFTKVYAEDRLPRLQDEADVLTEEEETNLLKKLDEISNRQQIDVAILTMKNQADKSDITAYADDYFDYNGFGFGSDGDGLVLVMDYGSRVWAISTKGKAITIFTDAGQKYITDKIMPYLSDGDSYKGFETYAELCDKYIEKAKEGKPYDVDNLPKERNIFFIIAGAVIPALLLAAIICGRLTSQLKTVAEQYQADNYVLKGSFNVTDAQDLFLYKNVVKTKIEKSSSSSGGSSTHTSSSGSTHGGSSGSF